jgi:hypothetical protein
MRSPGIQQLKVAPVGGLLLFQVLLMPLPTQVLCSLATKPHLFLGAARSSGGRCGGGSPSRPRLAWRRPVPGLPALGCRLSLLPVHIAIPRLLLLLPLFALRRAAAGWRRRLAQRSHGSWQGAQKQVMCW